MQNTNLTDRVVTESAMKLKKVAPSPLLYQMAIHEIFHHFDLSGLKYAVIPFAYDGTTWLAATQESKIRLGSLNNEYTPWATLLYVLRDNPLFLYDEMRDSSMDQIDYDMHLNLMNLFMRKLHDAKENDRRRFEEDDIYVCASRWLSIAEGASWANGSEFDNINLKNKYKNINRKIDLSKTKKYFTDLSDRLDGAFICDLDPFVHATMLLQADNEQYSGDDSIWIFTPEPHDMDKGTRLISQFAPILHERGAKFIAIVPEDEASCLYSITMQNGEEAEPLPGIDVSLFQFGGQRFIFATNLEYL